MPLWTTYLAFLRKADYNPLKVLPNELKETIFKYVMRDRGNNEVAPSKELLFIGKKALITWDEYAQNYLMDLDDPFALNWMFRVAQDSKRANVVLICFEKDASHCHRTLLANEIVRRHSDVDYRGELSEAQLKEA